MIVPIYSKEKSVIYRSMSVVKVFWGHKAQYISIIHTPEWGLNEHKLRDNIAK